jgi:farnesyl-diphosphate farnesyltransferase
MARDLLDSGAESKLRPVYNRWLNTARKNLHRGWDYANALPWRCFRLRLACAWPILIGLDTLGKLERGNILDPAVRIKTSRPGVRSIMIRSILACPWPWVWHSLVKTK